MSGKPQKIPARPAGTANGYHLYEGAMGSVYASKDGTTPVGVAGGPAADRSGEWFAQRWDANEATRVADRAAAIEHITTDPPTP